MRATDSRVCLGIDPRPEAHPLTHPDRFENDPAQLAKAVVQYFRAIIEATEDLIACAKLQAAFFEAMGIPGLIAMAQLLVDLRTRDIPVVLDAKRGDIGSTAEAYARAYLGEGVFGADALTVNPYLGMDSLEPFIKRAAKDARGVFVLVNTSNPGSRDFQDVRGEDGRALFERVAARVTAYAKALAGAGGYSPLGAVVGATHPPERVERLRELLPYSVLLMPGYGAQGGAAENLAAAFDRDGIVAMVSASRSLTYTGEGDHAANSRAAVVAMRDEINAVITTSR